MFSDKNKGKENSCTRCGFCCVHMYVNGLPQSLYKGGKKPSNSICHYLEIERDKASCRIHDSPNRPDACKKFMCGQPAESFYIEHPFLSAISRIPLNSDAEDGFRFYHKMWKEGHFREFSFRHFKSSNSSARRFEIGALMSDVRDFLYTHFERDDLPEDIKSIVSDPEWYNHWGVDELIKDLMFTSLPLDLYESSQKKPRLKVALIEWKLLDKIEEIGEKNSGTSRATIAPCKS